jgi:hypothetical protein
MAVSVCAYYYIACEFKLPKCLRGKEIKTEEDLDSHELIKDWGIKWNELTINWKDGTQSIIKPSYEQDHDYKRPDSTQIMEKDESMIEDLSDEEESEEEDEEDKKIVDYYNSIYITEKIKCEICSQDLKDHCELICGLVQAAKN